MDNTYPGKSVNVAPIVGGILAGMINPTANFSGEENSLLSGNSGVSNSNSTASPFSPPLNSAGLAEGNGLEEAYDENYLVKPKSGINFVACNVKF